MNMKTTKFLAVLAILAFAFAAFAIALPAEQDDAGSTAVTSFDITVANNSITEYVAGTTTIADGKGYYVTENATITLPANGNTHIMLFIDKGVTVTLKSTSGTGYAFAGLVNVKSFTGSMTIAFDSFNYNAPGSGAIDWSKDASGNAVTTVSSSLEWGQKAVSWQNGDEFAVTAASSGSGFSIAGGDVNYDAYGNADLTGSFGTITFKANVTLTMTNVTATIKYAAANGEFTVTKFTGVITASSSMAKIALSTWTSGDVKVSAGKTLTTSADMTTGGKLTVYGTLVTDANLTIAGEFDNKPAEGAFGVLSFTGNTKTLTIKNDITYYGKVNLSNATAPTISVDSGKTFKVVNEQAKSTNTVAYGIVAPSKALAISGAGKVDVKVTNTTTGTISNHINAYGIHVGKDGSLTITSGLAVSVTGTSEYTGETNLACGIGLSGGSITIGPAAKPTSLATVSVTGNDRAVDLTNASNDLKIQYVKGTFTGGEYGLRTVGTLTINGGEINAEIGTPKSNALGDTFGDGFVGIKANEKITVDKGASLNSESIIAKVGMDIKGESTVTVKYDAGAAVSNGVAYTGGSGSTFTNAAPIKGMSGLVSGAYASVSKTGTLTPVTYEDFITEAVVKVEKGSTLAVAPGCGIIAKIQNSNSATDEAIFNQAKATSGSTTGTAYSVVAVPMTVSGTSNLVFGTGSVVMDGIVILGDASDYTVDTTTGTITVTGNVEISGVVAENVHIDLSTNAVLTVPSGKTFTLNGTINASTTSTKVNVVGTVNGSGKIGTAGNDIDVYAVSESAISGLEGEKAKYKEPASRNFDPTGKSIEEIQEFMNNNLYVKLEKADLSIGAKETLVLPASLKLDLGGQSILVAENGELDVNGAIVVNSGTTGKIEVTGIMVIDAADVCVDVTVDAAYKGYISVKNPKSMSVSGALTSDVSVGYGNTMTLTGVTVPAGKNVYAFGKVIFEGTNIVKTSANLYVYTYGSAVVNGNLLIEGSAISKSGSFTVNGVLEISNDNGAATMDAKTIYNNGTLSVVKPRASTAVNSNSLTAKTVYNYSTMKVTGEFGGKIYDFGELTFNGTNTDAASEIVLSDGVSFTLTSVTGQPITIKDEASYTTMPDAFLEYSTTPKAYFAVSAGNAVVLKDVKNVSFIETVTVKVVEGTYNSKTANITCYTADLTVSGSIVATDDTAEAYKTIGMTGKTDYIMDHDVKKDEYSVSITKGKVIVDDMAIGKNVELTMNAGVKVAGTLTATAKTSRVVAADADNKVDVAGTIVIGDECGKTGAVQGILTNTNSAYFTVTDLESKVLTYYTTLKDALEDIAYADDDTVVLLGSISIKKADLVVPAGATLLLSNEATLTVSSTGSLEVEATALLNAINGKVVVDGVLQIDDKNTGFRFNSAKLEYQVYVENGDVAAYCGLLGALASAEPGDKITVMQSKTVKESFTIPTDVTVIVPTGIVLTLGSDSAKIKVTIDGTLVLERAAKLEKTGKEVVIAINGTLVKDKDAKITDFAQTTIGGKFTVNDYVTYSGKIEGRDTTFYSNLTDAVTYATSGTVTVYGKVSAGQVTLTKADSATELNLTMFVNENAPASISVISLTLDGSKVTVPISPYTTFNGSIAAAAGEDVAVITVANAYNFVVESGYEVTSAGNVDYMALSGSPVGDFAIADGTVTAVAGLVLAGTSNGDFIIAEDAILYIPEGATVTLGGAGAAAAEYNVINGAVLADEAKLSLKSVIVNGVITISENKTSEIVSDNIVYLNGSILTVSTDDNEALLTLNAKTGIIMGDRPEALASEPVLAGDFAINDAAYILVYDGDLSLAKMNWNAATETSNVKSTEFYINDELFCIAIGGSSPSVELVNARGTIYSAIIYEKFDLEGLDTTYIATAAKWMDKNGKALNVQNIGYSDVIYFEADAAIAKGTVSVGLGLVLYIDGVGYNYYGGKDVELTVGTHNVRYEVEYGYVGDNVVLTFNGKTIPVTATGATIDVTPDMVEEGYIVSVTGATPAPEPEPVTPEEKSEWTVTTILLCVLVVLIAIMAVIVALRLNRN